MGGEGSMMNANVSLKNNRNLLSKRKEKNSLSGSYANVKMANFPKATPREIRKIKDKMLKENKQETIKQYILCSILIVVITWILI